MDRLRESVGTDASSPIPAEVSVGKFFPPSLSPRSKNLRSQISERGNFLEVPHWRMQIDIPNWNRWIWDLICFKRMKSAFVILVFPFFFDSCWIRLLIVVRLGLSGFSNKILKSFWPRNHHLAKCWSKIDLLYSNNHTTFHRPQRKWWIYPCLDIWWVTWSIVCHCGWKFLWHSNFAILLRNFDASR
jgi:hypothetical protein